MRIMILIFLIFFTAIVPINIEAQEDKIPDYVYRKTGYVAYDKPPEGFKIIQGWFQVISDERKNGSAKVLVDFHELGCFIDGKKKVINRREYDRKWKKSYKGGLYLKDPWFGDDYHDKHRFPIKDEKLVIDTKGNKDKVFHWWTKRYTVPDNAENCYIKMKSKIYGPGLVQIGIDYWEEDWSFFDNGENNHVEGMASDWFYKKKKWKTLKIGIN